MTDTTRRSIMFVLPNLGGGAARVITTLLQHLDRERFRLHLVVVDTFYGWYLREVPDDVTVHILGKRRASRAVFKMLATIWRVRPEIVVSTQGYINFMLLFTHPFFPRCKLVVREVVGERYLGDNRYRDLFYRWYLRLVRRADCIAHLDDHVQLRQRDDDEYEKQEQKRHQSQATRWLPLGSCRPRTTSTTRCRT